MVYATRGLIDALLEEARKREPEPLTVGLDVTSARDFDGLDLPSGAAVFTHFYLPDAGRSLENVFGVDLSTPPGRTPGMFVSHPDGSPTVSRTDDLRETVFVAVPPWNRDSVTAFGRDGRRQRIELVDARLAPESPP